MNEEQVADGLTSMKNSHSVTLVTNLRGIKYLVDLHVKTASDPVPDQNDEATTTFSRKAIDKCRQLMQTLDKLAEGCLTYAEKFEAVVKGPPFQ